MAETGPDGAVLAADALEWLLAVAQERGTALAWTGRPDDDELDPTLYSGAAGIVLAFLEAYQHFGDDRYAQAAARGARTVAEAVGQEWELSSLYLGLAGMAFALRAVGDAQVFRLLAQVTGNPAWAAWLTGAGTPSPAPAFRPGCSQDSGTTAVAAAARPESSPWPATGRMSRETGSPSPMSCSVTWC
jgi:Lanthionine synthetase C-like protein